MATANSRKSIVVLHYRKILVALCIIYIFLCLQTWQTFKQNQPADIPANPLALSQLQPTANSATIHPQISRRRNSPLEDISSVDYYACCGLGHRLIRMASAAYVAKQRGWALRSFWGWCGEQNPMEVFSHLFRPQSEEELMATSTTRKGDNQQRATNQIISFHNEVPGFSALQRTGTGDRIFSRSSFLANTTDTQNQSASSPCPCQAEKITSDYEFYSSLRSRFRKSKDVDDFVSTYFSNATVIGIHIRAGNGEAGDFSRKGRNIQDPQNYVHLLGNLIRNWLASAFEDQQLQRHPPVLYIATDTPSMIELLRDELQTSNYGVSHSWKDPIPVLDLPQQARPKEGQGVLFGEAAHVHNARNAAQNGTANDDDAKEAQHCLKGWSDTLMDQFLLSHADVVIAGTPSSFSQTLPMSIALNRANNVVSHSYCEIIPQNAEIENSTEQQMQPKLQCYSSFMHWCCNHPTWIKLVHKRDNGRTRIIDKEFIKMINPNLVGKAPKNYPIRNRTKDCLRPRRGRIGGGVKDKCLPHFWLD